MKKFFVFALTVLLLLVISLNTAAAGVHYDSLTLSENADAKAINKAICSIEKIDTVSYSSRHLIYNARNDYNALSNGEKEYVVNYGELAESLELLNRIGDVSSNDVRDAEDVSLLIGFLIGKDAALSNTDINGDGKTDILDLIAIKKLMAGI